MTNSTQIRVRLPSSQAQKWLVLPPSSRAKAVAMILNAAGELNLAELVKYRRELVNLGTLLNQSLEASHGQQVDEITLGQCVALLKKLTES